MQANPEVPSGRIGPAVFVVLVLAVSTLFAAYSLPAWVPGPSQNVPAPAAVSQGLGSFQNTAQLVAYISANAKSASQYQAQGGFFGGGVARLPPVAFAGGAMDITSTGAVAAFSASVVSHTGTNVQVAGVDELDRVKTDGTHLFVSNHDSVTIIDAYPPSSAAIAATLRFPGEDVTGIEIAQGRLLVVGQGIGSSRADLMLYNTADVSAPVLMKNLSISGSFLAARLSEGYVYAIVQQPSFSYVPGQNASGVLPSVTQNGLRSELPATSVYHTSDASQISYYSVVASMGISDGSVKTVSVLTGPSSTVYVSNENIYVVYMNIPDWYADGIPGDVFTGGMMAIAPGRQSETSSVVRVAYLNGSLQAAAAGTVPGNVLNQFSLDEYNGYFRLATSRFAVISNTTTRSDDVYVLNMTLGQVSSLVNIAPGENIYSVRFSGEMGYVVTFQQIDPLFAISFKDMTHPVIESALKVTGYSDYLHPLPGGYLLGVGKDAVPSSDGNFAWYLGLKISLFHIMPDGSSSQVSKLLIGDRGTDSPVLSDHLAFTFDGSNNVTVIPVTLAQVSGNQTYGPNTPPPYGDTVWQGVYVIKVSNAGLSILGRVSQYTSPQNYGNAANDTLVVDRSVIIGNVLYTVSQGEVMLSDLASFATLNILRLPA